MRVLLTGAAGFVGSHLLTALRARGAEVIAADQVAEAGMLVMDVTDRTAVRRVVAEVRPDALLHAAALTPGPDVADGRGVAAVNTHGTFTVFEAARPIVRRALLVSSAAVFGAPSGGFLLAEDAPVGPLSVYGASKLAAETVARRLVPEATVVRLSAIYGPGERPRDTRPRTSPVHRLLAAASAAPEPDITLDLLHAEDAAAWVATLLLGPAPARGLFHAGGGEPVRWTRLLRALRDAGHALADGPDVRVTDAESRPVLDIARIVAATGMRPRPIEDGARTLLPAG